MDFANALRMELGRRGVAEASCPRIIAQRERSVAIGVAVGVTALVLAASRHHDVGVDVELGVATTLGGYESTVVASDSDWAWDQFNDGSARAIWACRGLQTGVVADPARCEGKQLADSTWPGLGR